MKGDKQFPIKIVHELDCRLRLRCGVIRRMDFNPDQLEMQLESMAGVSSARCNTPAASVTVEYDGSREVRQAILLALAEMPESFFGEKEEPRTLLSVLPLVGKGILCGSLLFLPPLIAAPITFALAAPVIAGGIATLWTKGIKIEVLDAVAVSFCLLRKDYFTAGSILFLLSVGEYFEELSEDRSTDLLKSLLKPQVEKVWVESEDGQEIEVALEDVRIGDHVVCGPGEMIPLDGVVFSGEATIDTSSITGESLPLPVAPGDEVLSGAVLEEGRIIIEAKRIGADSSMARISTFLENSLRNQSESQKRGDELAESLVPVTFGLGLGLLALTRDLEKAAAVLTVDYSCAIKLVNPVAIRVAMYNGARQGVLLKGAQAMDGLAKLDVLVFDKTGTLTRGQLEVTDVCPAGKMSADELLILAASAEEHYSHPVADAVVSAAKKKGLALAPTSQVDFIVAHGVSAYVDGENTLVGSRHFIEDDVEIDCSALNEKVAALEQEGKSILYIARGGKFAGVIGLRDELRPESAAVLEKLKESGIGKIVILTGDSKVTAEALAGSLDAVDEIHAELKPEDKARIVGELQEGGKVVGFIGDGVNDAPALVSADVGICLPGGADLAKESAQIILLQDDLYSLLAGRHIALLTRQTIERSFWAVVSMNTAFLLLATFGLLPPVGAALLHNLSTVGVLGYASLRSKKNVREELLEEENDV